MLFYHSEKIKEEYNQAPVALRLIVDAVQFYCPGMATVFRVKGRKQFERGSHHQELAVDLLLHEAPYSDHIHACKMVNAKFGLTVATAVPAPCNMPSGKRADLPHVHVQIPFDWKADPRSFLKAYGFIKGDIPSP